MEIKEYERKSKQDNEEAQRWLDSKKYLYSDRVISDEEADYSQAIEYIYQNEKEALKNKCYDKGHILENIPREFHRYGARIITEYDRKLKENHGCDFTDLIVNAYQLLQDKTVSDVWSAKYKYINVDEMQDTSKLEYTILEKIFGVEENNYHINWDTLEIKFNTSKK